MQRSCAGKKHNAFEEVNEVHCGLSTKRTAGKQCGRMGQAGEVGKGQIM